MKLSYLALAVFAPLCAFGSCCAQEANPPKPAVFWYSEQFTLHSKRTGRDYLIQVAKPIKAQPEKLPAVYLLDGNTLFGEVAGMLTSYGYFGDTGPAYVVAIGYSTGQLDQWLSLRSRDLLHVHLPNTMKVAAVSGGGAQFEEFLLDELRPVIESRYPVDPQRTILAGHSFGGLFTLHVLLNNTEAFRHYLICSPSIWAEPQLLDKASTFHTATSRRIFIGVGSKEEKQFGVIPHMVGNAQMLADRLNNHASGADITFTDFEGQNHGTVIAGCLSEGLQFLLPAPSVAPAH